MFPKNKKTSFTEQVTSARSDVFTDKSSDGEHSTSNDELSTGINGSINIKHDQHGKYIPYFKFIFENYD